MSGGNLKSSRLQDSSEHSETLHVLPAASINPTPISWLWRDWIARGKLHVLAGAPGTGKTTLALSLAATITVGGRWPDGTTAAAGKVVIWSGEDDPQDTLLPRLIAARANLGNVFFVGDVGNSEGNRSFDPAFDVPLLEEKLRQIGDVALLLVDPVVNAVAGDSHKNGEVRRALRPLVGMAQQHGVAVLGISHFSKGTAGREPIERVTGSLAFGAVARVVMVAAKGKPTEDGDSPRILARAKSNIGPDEGGINYLIESGPLPGHHGIETSWVQWGPATEGSARDLLAAYEPADDGEGGSAQEEAEEFLRDILSSGAKPARDVRKAASAAGLSWATVRRARNALGIRSVKRGMGGGWEWTLSAEGAQKLPKVLKGIERAPSGSNEHLRYPVNEGDGRETVG